MFPLPPCFPLLLTLTLLPHPFRAAILCYHPNGDLVTDASYVPCNRAAALAGSGSMCCALNRSSYPDQCLSNGLCGGGGNVFRDSCTDRTWKGAGCLQLCTRGTGESGTAVGVSEETTLDYSQSDIQITDCNDGSYCCGPSNTTCCRRGHGQRIASILEVPLSTSSASTSSTSATATSNALPTSTTTSPVSVANIGAATTVAAAKKDAPGLDQKATIGVAVSCSVVGIAIASALAWFFVRKRRLSSGAGERPELTGVQELKHNRSLHEKDASPIRYELSDGDLQAELDSGARAELKG